MERERLKWRNFLALEAGFYILTEETRPEHREVSEVVDDNVPARYIRVVV